MSDTHFKREAGEEAPPQKLENDVVPPISSPLVQGSEGEPDAARDHDVTKNVHDASIIPSRVCATSDVDVQRKLALYECLTCGQVSSFCTPSHFFSCLVLILLFVGPSIHSLFPVFAFLTS